MSKNTSFSASPEAQEYIQELQAGKRKLPKNAQELEQHAFVALDNLRQNLQKQSRQRDDFEKQINMLSGQRDNLSREIDILSGQMAAYAEILVAAEGNRRQSAAVVPAASGPDTINGQPAKAEPEAEAKTEEPEPKQKANGKVTPKASTKASAQPAA